MRKEAFLSYIYGYLNLVRVMQMRIPEGMTWKDFKITEAGLHLGLSQRLAKGLLKPFAFLSPLEIAVSCPIVFFRFLSCLARKPFLADKPLDARILMVEEGFPQEDLIAKTDIDKKDIISMVIPFTCRNDHQGVRHANVLSKLSYKEICVSFVWSLRLMGYMNRKYGRRDLFMRYYSSFEFFLAYLFAHHVGDRYDFLFISTYSRWAYLNGSLPNRKTFIQHGFLSGKWDLVRKIGLVDEAYYISEDQRLICERMLFRNRPAYKYETKLVFTYFPPADKTCVLIVGNSSYNEPEENVIAKLSGKPSLLLLIKPHPNTKNAAFYQDMVSRHGILLLGREDYPKVDYVISYNSTLATQYENVGIPVYRYADEHFEDEICSIQ